MLAREVGDSRHDGSGRQRSGDSDSMVRNNGSRIGDVAILATSGEGYLPERGIVELRDLTRRRKKMRGNLASEKNRIQKTLEVANVKIGNVMSDVFGISGRRYWWPFYRDARSKRKRSRGW
jgi:hypothetical protein